MNIEYTNIRFQLGIKMEKQRVGNSRLYRIVQIDIIYWYKSSIGQIESWYKSVRYLNIYFIANHGILNNPGNYSDIIIYIIYLCNYLIQQ